MSGKTDKQKRLETSLLYLKFDTDLLGESYERLEIYNYNNFEEWRKIFTNTQYYHLKVVLSQNTYEENDIIEEWNDNWRQYSNDYNEEDDEANVKEDE